MLGFHHHVVHTRMHVPSYLLMHALLHSSLVSRASDTSKMYPTFRKNPRKYCKNPILPEDPRSQKTRRRGARRAPHHLVVQPRPGRAKVW
jgi:hypothetical protein